MKAISVHSSHSSCHAIILSLEGDAYLFGRNSNGCLGIPSATLFVSENEPLKLQAKTLGGEKFTYAACGRNHSILVGNDGQVWAAGANNYGQVRIFDAEWNRMLTPTDQCGHLPCPETVGFRPVTNTWGTEKIVKASAGLTFSLLLTESGKGVLRPRGINER